MTKTNTTKEVGEEIAKILTENNLTVDLLPISDVTNMDMYDGIIIGGPINGMRWVSEATSFIKENQHVLSQKKTALYFVSYLIYDGRKLWKKSIKSSLNSSMKLINTSKTGMFGGKIEAMFPAIARVLFGIKKDAPLETIKWDDIRRWAKELANYFVSN